MDGSGEDNFALDEDDLAIVKIYKEHQHDQFFHDEDNGVTVIYQQGGFIVGYVAHRAMWLDHCGLEMDSQPTVADWRAVGDAGYDLHEALRISKDGERHTDTLQMLIASGG